MLKFWVLYSWILWCFFQGETQTVLNLCLFRSRHQFPKLVQIAVLAMSCFCIVIPTWNKDEILEDNTPKLPAFGEWPLGLLQFNQLYRSLCQIFGTNPTELKFWKANFPHLHCIPHLQKRQPCLGLSRTKDVKMFKGTYSSATPGLHLWNMQYVSILFWLHLESSLSWHKENMGKLSEPWKNMSSKASITRTSRSCFSICSLSFSWLACSPPACASGVSCGFTRNMCWEQISEILAPLVSFPYEHLFWKVLKSCNPQ